jgi:imidazolonepropionase-like amidohydrolase
MVSEAHRLGLRTTAHAMNRRDLRRALDAGIDALEHPAFMIERGRAVELPDELVAEIVRRHVFIVPLLVAMEVYNRFAREPSLLDDPALVNGLRPELVADARAWARDEHDAPGAIAALDARYAQVRENQAKLIRAGALVAMGTDRGTRLNWHEHGNHVRELEIYTELGMTALQAITSATLRGAQLLGAERRFGTIEPGKVADLLIVDGDPATHITDLAHVKIVFRNGARVR